MARKLLSAVLLLFLAGISYAEPYLFTNGHLVTPREQGLIEADVMVGQDRIVAVGDRSGVSREHLRVIDMQDEFERIAEGVAADLLLLGANPLEDIRHTSGVRAVMLRGRWMDQDERIRRLTQLSERYARIN